MDKEIDLYGINRVVTDSTDAEFERMNDQYVDLMMAVEAGADDALIAGIARNLAETFLMVEERLTAELGPNNFLNQASALMALLDGNVTAH